jgi:hypothetical protein
MDHDSDAIFTHRYQQLLPNSTIIYSTKIRLQIEIAEISTHTGSGFCVISSDFEIFPLISDHKSATSHSEPLLCSNKNKLRDPPAR